ncbi:LamG domain-containing protein [Micromonospora sp. NPDC047707]|uniref:LamG domain-containing protein n=1 Tax=Micromonospora sp. NPDC047707 TaxID=3154498 RepID=UPI003456ECD1
MDRGTPGFRLLRRAGLAAGLAGLVAAYATTASAELTAPTPPAETESAAMVPTSGDGPIRQTEVDALAAAKATGQRVEIGAFRGENTETYANPNGTLTSVTHVQPVRVSRGGRWVPVDSTLVRAKDGSLVPAATTIGMRLSGGGDGPLIEVDRAGRRMSLDWPGNLPNPTVQGDRATYPEVLPGVDLVVNVGVSGFSHVLVIKNAEAAKSPELAELDFGLATDGLEVRQQADGSLRAVDAVTGGAVLESATPIMWDSGTDAAGATGPAARSATPVDPDPASAAEKAPDSARRAELGVRVHHDKITLIPDRAMLTDPAVRWPVYVDPVWQDTKNTGWAMVASGYPNEEYWKFGDDEGVGECPVSSGWCNGVGIKRLFYALPTPYSGKTILSAEFAVTMTHTYDGSAKGIALYRAGAAIGSGTNWGNQPAMSVHQETKSPTATRSSCTTTNQNVTFNATAAVKEAVTKGWGTTTFGMRAVSETDHTAWKRFCGNAILSVNYNRAPSQPKQSEMTMSPGGQCVTGSTRPYTSAVPTVYFVLRDPDHSSIHTENVKGEVQYWWYSGSTKVSRTYQTAFKASGSRFQYTLPTDIPQNTTISWNVKAYDGTAWGLLAATACEFIYDSTKPTAPDIDSAEYLPNDASETTSFCAEDDNWRGSVGTYGTFTFDTPATDATKYIYGFNTNPSPTNVLTPAAAGGPVSIAWMPENDGPNFVTVKAVDQGGLESTIATCTFSVPTRLAAGEWGLGEAAGASSLADARDRYPATPGAGVQIGVPGPGCQDTGDLCQLDRAVRFSGAADSYLSTTSSALVDTSGGFGVAAWVRLTNDTTDRVAVSQDGSGEPGFTLGFDGGTKKWEFGIPTTDVNALGGWKVTSSTTATIGEWTHLAAAYDPVKKTIQLYVNGVVQTAQPRRSAWKSRGSVQIGRQMVKGGHTGHWVGELADIALFDRILVPNEAVTLSRLRPVRLAYWPLDGETASRSPAYDENGQDLVLANGAHLYTPDLDADPFAELPLGGAGHLVLDGADDHALTEAPVVATDGSFTVTARVRLPSSTCGRDMAVVSQAGSKASGFVVRCSAANRWELAVPAADTVGAATTTVHDSVRLPHAGTGGQYLAVVYDAFRNEVRLYVDGQLATTATAPHSSTWKAAGPLQVGRAMTDGVFGAYLSGQLDDVRAYTGVVDEITIQQLASPEPNPNI